MNHEMKLALEPYNKIKEGSKTVESRLFDEKRRAIKLGDTITFHLNDGTGDGMTKEVVALHQYPSFEKMMSDLPATRFGWTEPVQAIEEINRFYSQDEQIKLGVIGIQLG